LTFGWCGVAGGGVPGCDHWFTNVLR
jgi:hypothetical protein